MRYWIGRNACREYIHPDRGREPSSSWIVTRVAVAESLDEAIDLWDVYDEKCALEKSGPDEYGYPHLYYQIYRCDDLRSPPLPALRKIRSDGLPF